MLKDKNKAVFFLISFLFIALNLVFIAYDFYYIAFLPVLILFLFTAIVSIDKIFLLAVFFTPLSVRLDEFIPGIPVNLSLPTEPLLAGILVLFIFKLLLDGKFNKKILLHPVSIAIFINLLWIFITSITSTMPGVSFKFFLSRLWFVVGAYFLATHIFSNIKNVERFVWLYIISLVIVIIYTNIRLSGYGLDNQNASNWVVTPFFNDHTSYGAMLVMFFFPLIYFIIKNKKNVLLKYLSISVFLIFCVAIVLSYTRAAWLSFFAGVGLWILIKFRIKIRYVLIAGIALIALFFVVQNKIIYNLEKNESESSGKFSEHIESMANITSDASNTERINRWKCAYRMFKEKPIFGWGPGTYVFQYAPFQFSYDRTIISTNFGDLGNAHSEYLGPLSESGFFGMISFILVVFMAFRTGYRVFHKAKSKQIQNLTLFIILGLATYFTHGFLNNFLDTDKASIPVWGFMAVLVALEIYHVQKEEIT